MSNRLFLALVVLSVFFTRPVASYTSYTDPKSFEADIMHYIGHTSENFDDQTLGSPASDYGILAIHPTGLKSDGIEPVKLKPIATSDYPGWSGRNVLATPSDYGDQFLSGNSDTIRFSFSSPVYAFGVYLIGNPSPTGRTAIPFWRMEIGSDIFAYKAYSSTIPLTTLGGGNDVYFLGVISEKTPISEVYLYSDNDPSAVFSFNIDDVLYASLPDEVSLVEAKSLSSGYVRVKAVVTRVHQDRFNIETPDRAIGMAVMGTGAVRGREISVMGSVGLNSDYERVIELSQILWQSHASAPKPRYLGSKYVGGSTRVGIQPEIPGSIGPNNVGIDAAICGKITAIAQDYSWMSVDDGAGRPLMNGATGVLVLGEINAGQRRVGDYVSVQGSVAQFRYKGTLLPAIRVASAQDIVP